MTTNRTPLLIVLLWFLLVVISLIGRSYIPIDETRYVTVAWNMWLNGDYLVPYLNGIAYSHKPPLLFWLINIGWEILGVNDWWPRVVPSLFALAGVFVTRKIASRLWPDLPQVKDNASLILLSSCLWVVFSTALMFDMLVAFFTLLGILGVLIAAQDKGYKGWLMLALAIGLGLLAKGPTILLQILPVAVLGRWWSTDKSLNAKNWFLPILYSVLGGIALALVWAIPAGIHGGSEYQHAIFWGQTANRMVESFAHKRPVWWYVPLLPLLLFPWLFWGGFWQGVFSRQRANDMGIKFCIAWALPVFIAFSFISGKQVHYLLPIFPAVALLIARLSVNSKNESGYLTLPISLALLVFGALFLQLPNYAATHAKIPQWVEHIPLWLGWLIIAASVLLFLLRKKPIQHTVAYISIISVTLSTLCLYAVLHATGSAYDVRPISRKLQELESQHYPLAYIGRYPGIFNFTGRLNQSPENVHEVNLETWFASHPDGRVIKYFHNLDDATQYQTEFAQNYKGVAIGIINYHQWLANKGKTTQKNEGSEDDNS